MFTGFFKKFSLLLVVLVMLPTGVHRNAMAASAADFYKGKVVRFIVPFPPGGGYDTYSRLIASAMEKYMDVTSVVINKPGGGGLVGMNYFYNSASRDGLTIGIAPEGLPLAQLIGAQGVKFDCRKFQWLGSIYRDVRLLGVAKNSPYQTLAEFAKAKGLKAAETAITGPTGTVLVMAIEALGLDSAKIVSGYPGSPQQILAVKRGEADFIVISLFHFLRDRSVLHPLAVIGDKRIPEMPDLPALFAEYPIKAEARTIVETIKTGKAPGRALVAPPEVPVERVNYLRQIMMTCLKDKELLKKAKTLKLFVEPLPGDQVQAFVDKTFNISPDDIQKLKYILLEKYQ